MRGTFTAGDAQRRGATLVAYAIGLIPFVLIRSVTAPFFARGDTATPVKASLIAVAVNIGFKIALMGRWRRSALRSRPRSAPGSISALSLWFALARGICSASMRG